LVYLKTTKIIDKKIIKIESKGLGRFIRFQIFMEPNNQSKNNQTTPRWLFSTNVNIVILSLFVIYSVVRFLKEGAETGVNLVSPIGSISLLLILLTKKYFPNSIIAKKFKIIIGLWLILIITLLSLLTFFRYQEIKQERLEPGQEKMVSAIDYINRAEVESNNVKKAFDEGKDIRTQPFSDNLQSALSYATKATELDSTNPEIWFRRGNIYSQFIGIAVGAEEWALKSYQKASELAPDNQLYRQKVEELTKNEIANWETYRNEEYGFEIKYPNQYINSDFASGKTPEVIILSAPSSKIDEDCFYYPYPDYPQWGIMNKGKIKLNNIDFCLSEAADAGLGSVFPTYYYTTKYNDNYFVIKFETRRVGNCDAYYDSTEQSECEEFQKNIGEIIEKPIENIVSTFKFLK